MSTYQLEIDGSGAEAGAERIVRSFDAIKAAADRMEGGVSAAAKKASSSFSDIQKAARPVSEAAIKSLQNLSQVFKNFRAPSDAAVRNTIIFLQGLKSVGTINIGRLGGLQGLLNAISGYKGPGSTAGKNTLALLNALRFVSTFSMPRGLIPTLNALTSFKGPNAAAGRNTLSLLNALANFKGGVNLSKSIAALHALAAAANSARSSLNNLKGAGPSSVVINPQNTARIKEQSIATRELTKAHLSLQTMLYRTQTAWNALGGVLAARQIIGASNDIIKIQAQLQAATGSVQQARVQFNYLREISEKLGLEFVSTAKSFGFFLGAVKGTNLTFKESQQIFLGFSTAARALQLSTADVDGVFRALGQMMSKGKIQAEELRGQLGDRLPGAFVRFAVALKMTKPGELDKALKDGAVSGEKMKNAIIDVARALEVEFAGSANKMSQTVEAAFNRLRNSFTFASAALGQGGLNSALINLLDTARKFLTSTGVNTFLSGLAKVIKSIGDNIETIVFLMGVAAVNATFKWILGLQGLAKAIVAVEAAIKAVTIITAAMSAMSVAGMSKIGIAVFAVQRAFVALSAAMKAHPLFFIAAILGAAYLAFQKLREGTDEQKQAFDNLNSKMADGKNLTDAIIERQIDLAKATGDTTSEIVKQVKAMNDLALAGAAKDISGYNPAWAPGMTRGLRGESIQVNGSDVTPEQQAFLNRFITGTSNGRGYTLRNVSGGLTNPDERGFRQLLSAMGTVGVRANGPEGDVYRPLLNQLQGLTNALISSSRTPGYSGNPYEAWAKKYGGDYNRERVTGGGITGDPTTSSGSMTQQQAYTAFKRELEKEGFRFGALQGFRTYKQQADLYKKYGKTGDAAAPGTSAHEFYKGLDLPAGADPAKIAAAAARAGVTLGKSWTHGKNAGGLHRHQTFSAGRAGPGTDWEEEQAQAAEQWANKLTSNVDKAIENLSDLRVEAKAAGDVVDKVLGGSFDAMGLAALQAGRSQEKAFEDTFEGVEEKSKGVLALAKQLQDSGDIGKDVDISTYDKAKAAITDVMTATQKLNMEQEKSAELAKRIADMRGTNDVQERAQAVLEAGGSQREYNKELEIETALLGTSADKRDALRKSLGEEIDRRNALTDAMERNNAQREYENQLALNKALTPLYKSGVKREDIDYYKEMLQYRQQLIDDGRRGEDLQNMVNLHAATLNEARAMKVLTDQYEKAQQTAADMADAIVGGFREGIEAGDSFLDIFKNIFKQIKNIMLDFVVYNPLKQWLQQSMSSFLAPMQSGQAGVGSPGMGTVNSYSTSGGIIQSTVSQTISSIMQNGIGAGSPTNNGGAAGFGQSIFSSLLGGGGTPNRSIGSNFGHAIVITGSRLPGASAGATNASIPMASGSRQMSFFQNFGATMKASQEGFRGFTAMLKGGKITGAGISGAIGAAGTALAMYQTGNAIGKGVAKALGGGFRTQAVAGGITGGAAAGFSLAGPVGAAVGAVVGGVLGFLKKKPKVPSSYGSVVVGDTGVAATGAVGKYGKTTTEAGTAASGAGARLFNSIALEFGGRLTPGNYGTFGSRVFDKKTGSQSFYSMSGVDRKGKPIGTEGVNWIKGSDSQVQAFALINQVNRGMIAGLSDTIKTVFANTKAKDMDALQADLEIGKAFDEFVKGSFKITEVASKIRDLNETFNRLKAQATQLGLSESKLAAARDRMMGIMKDEFNYQIKQGILEITNPAQAAFNELVRQYRDSVEEAMAVGGDLTAVEDLYGKKRAEIIKQWSETATNGLVSSARDLYNQLTASSSSPLNASTVLGNSRGLYRGLISQFDSGNFQNADQLSGFATNYLDAARNMYGSSTSYFDIFREVTDALNRYSTPGSGPGAGTSVPAIPDLPTLDSLVAEVNSNSLEMIGAMGTVGQAVVEGSTSIVDAIQNLAIALGRNIPATSPTPTGPTAGGTGVESTGGVAPSGGSGGTSTSVYSYGGLSSSYGGSNVREGISVSYL